MTSINDMNYVEFISFLKETNRCPGGKDTIRWILQNSFANPSCQVLEVGSNTGFSSLEVARTAKCKVLGVDPVPDAVAIAQKDLANDSQTIQDLVTFEVGSAYDLPCESNSIDLIIAGGSTSFMDKKDIAIREMFRVLKPWGMLSVTNLYYHTPPPLKVLDEVSKVIGVTIQPLTSSEWKNVYLEAEDFELYAYETTHLGARSDAELDEYVTYFLQKPHIQALSAAEQTEIANKWRAILDVFNENHRYLGFMKALLRKRTSPEEPELFVVDKQ